MIKSIKHLFVYLSFDFAQDNGERKSNPLNNLSDLIIHLKYLKFVYLSD